MKAYRLSKGQNIDGLTLENTDIPKPGIGQALIRVHACSLNYRDLMIITGKYPSSVPIQPGTIPLSDFSGKVTAVGPQVERVRTGDRVCGIFVQKWIAGRMKPEYAASVLGGPRDGVLAQYVVLDQEGLVHIPEHLSYEEAATLPCAGVTAWNALFGGVPIGPDGSVLVLGTGGVSIFALQFAHSAGARVIITSSDNKKLERALSLGANNAINYKEIEDWDKEVRKLTGEQGVDQVIEIGGPGTLPRSVGATRMGGQVDLIGFLAGQQGKSDVALDLIKASVTLRGIMVGSREHFEAMNKAIEQNKLRPVIDKVFPFDQAKEAYKYLQSGQHFGKVVIRVE